MRPVRADSRMPKGEMSFMKESIRVGFADLCFGLVVVLCWARMGEDRVAELTPQQYSC